MSEAQHANTQESNETKEEELGSIVGPSEAIEEVIRHTSLTASSDPFHDDVYISVQDGVINTIARTGSTLSYCTYTEASNLQEINAVEGGCEAIVQVAKYLSYQDFASQGDTVRLSFRGNPDKRLASVAEFTGALNSRIMLPASPTLIEDVPTGFPSRYDDDDNFALRDGGLLPTTIETNTDELARIIEVAEYDSETKFFPIAVEDGDFVLDIGKDDQRDAVWGSLSAINVETEEDVHNKYHKGFEPAFSTLNGPITLQTGPGGKPLSVVQDEYGGVTIRHLIGNVNT